MARPRRVVGFSYRGVVRYFLTICTRKRLKAFRDDTTAANTLGHFRRIAKDERFAILAYCVMPDHVHFLVEGQAAESDFRRFVRRAKQHSGAAYALSCDEPLWQDGYYERILRDDSDAAEFARYIVWNPVRAGLVLMPEQYLYLGSDAWPIEELLRA